MSYYYSNAIVDSKILIAPYQTKSSKTKQNKTKMTGVYEQFLIKNWLKNSGRNLFLPKWQKPVSAKVAETLVETCFCQDGLNQCWQKLANPFITKLLYLKSSTIKLNFTVHCRSLSFTFYCSQVAFFYHLFFITCCSSLTSICMSDVSVALNDLLCIDVPLRMLLHWVIWYV